MQVLKKVDWKMFVARSFWRWVPVGLTVGVWCFVGGNGVAFLYARRTCFERADEDRKDGKTGGFGSFESGTHL